MAARPVRRLHAELRRGRGRGDPRLPGAVCRHAGDPGLASAAAAGEGRIADGHPGAPVAAEKADRKPKVAERLARAAAAVVTPMADTTTTSLRRRFQMQAARRRRRRRSRCRRRRRRASPTRMSSRRSTCCRRATSQDTDLSDAQLDRLGALLLETLRTFKVEGTISGRTTGPVVTQFEVVPAPGVKAQRIVALADDLAMAMRAPSIRVAPIPGKGAVGRRGAESQGAHGHAARAARVAGVGGVARHAAAGARPRHRGQADRGRPGQDAAPPDRRRHRHRQVGGDQQPHHQPDLPLHAARTAAPHGRPEDGRALHVQHAATPAAQGGDAQSRCRLRCSSGRCSR